MALTVFRISIPVFVRGLGVLSSLLTRGAAHERGRALVEARLAPDMLTLAGQVQRASDTAKLAAARLTGTEAPRFADEETTFEQLQDRIRRTIDYLQSFPAAQFEDSEGREITIGSGDSTRRFDGTSYVLTFALPNFFFYVTTAYDILRHEGVALGKRDYLWPADLPA